MVPHHSRPSAAAIGPGCAPGTGTVAPMPGSSRTIGACVGSLVATKMKPEVAASW